jgi:hypothetical protein
MAYTIVEDFAGGLDVRKSPVTTRPGALLGLTNAFINAGGEIEKRKTFTNVAMLPAGTKGLGFVNNTAYVFGTGAAPTMPAYTAYQQLAAPGRTIDRVLDVTRFADKLYVIAVMDDATTRHFFDGAEIVALRDEGTNATPHQNKMYVADGKNLRLSAVGDPADTAGTGSGLIDITAQHVGSTNLIGIEQYYSYLALFGETSVQIWGMDPDPVQNAQIQVLANIGLVAPHAAAQYGNGDVLFLSHTGIRSLRARDSSNAAVLNDIGSPIDKMIAIKRALLTPALAEKIRGMVDPLTGHFWLIWGTEIYVLSLYPASKVTAWSIFSPNISIDEAVLANSRILVRSGDQLFVYGTSPASGNPFEVNAPVGADPAEYDASPVEVITPFMSFGTPATEKEWTGVDIACEGEWEVYVNPEPGSPNAWTKVAEVTSATYDMKRIPLDMRSTHIAFKFTSAATGPAKLSAIGVHHEGGEAS